MGTFLGNATRRFYGLGPAPKHLSLIWSTAIGSGWTSGKFADDPSSVWSGTGWTGEPALVRDGGKLYILIGGYDHNLHKIDAATGKIIWKYPFDDIIKSSPSVIANPSPTGKDDKYIVMAGSRRGYPLKIDDPRIASYRAVAFGSGKELWRLPVPQTICYSRDCDGSGFYLAGREYIGVEPGWFYALDPLATEPWGKYRQPKVLAKRLLLGTPQDAKSHGSDLAMEASPALLNGTIYIDSGAGEVYGLRPSDLKVVFDYHTGSDIDGTCVPTLSGKLLVPVEKQYIPGHGGVLMLDPSKPAAQSLVWYFPTGDRHIGDWAGGIIGSVGVNDDYNPGGHRPALAAFLAIDGNVYVVSQDTLAKQTVSGPNLETRLADARARGQGLGRRRHLDADLHRRRPHRHQLRRESAPVPPLVRAQQGRNAGSSARQGRHVVEGEPARDLDVHRRRLLRVDAHRLGRPRVRGLAQRLLLLPGRQVDAGRRAHAATTARGACTLSTMAQESEGARP